LVHYILTNHWVNALIVMLAVDVKEKFFFFYRPNSFQTRLQLNDYNMIILAYYYLQFDKISIACIYVMHITYFMHYTCAICVCLLYASHNLQKSWFFGTLSSFHGRNGTIQPFENHKYNKRQFILVCVYVIVILMHPLMYICGSSVNDCRTR